MPDRNQLLAVLLKELARVLDTFERHGFEPFIEEWTRYHAYQDKMVQVSFADDSVRMGLQSVLQRMVLCWLMLRRVSYS